MSRTGAAALLIVLGAVAGGCRHDRLVETSTPFCAGGAHLSAEGDKTDHRLRDLAFMRGVWGMVDKDHYSEEYWSAPSGTCVMGAFRIVKPDGAAALFELITITAEADGVMMRLRHFDGALTPWATEAEGPIVLKLESADGKRAVFRKMSGSKSLDSIVYERVSEQTLESSVVFTPESGRETLRFEMGRVR